MRLLTAISLALVVREAPEPRLFPRLISDV